LLKALRYKSIRSAVVISSTGFVEFALLEFASVESRGRSIRRVPNATSLEGFFVFFTTVLDFLTLLDIAENVSIYF
jgi:hypothetical protein